MPSVPGSGFELVILLLFELPGTVYQFVRSRLRGPRPDDSSALNRVPRTRGQRRACHHAPFPRVAGTLDAGIGATWNIRLARTIGCSTLVSSGATRAGVACSGAEE